MLSPRSDRELTASSMIACSTQEMFVVGDRDLERISAPLQRPGGLDEL